MKVYKLTNKKTGAVRYEEGINKREIEKMTRHTDEKITLHLNEKQYQNHMDATDD